MTFIERVWYGDDAAARAARITLAPLATVYGAMTAIRGALFDRGVLPVHVVELPTVSVGNLAVGGTGKTPLAAWIARALRERGADPAIVLRGYGGDEAAVHEELNPSIPVIVDPNRVRGVASAAARGNDIAVLDDAFQHRRASRTEDVVLISADRWRQPCSPLPAGPWREPVSSLRRASFLVITRKAAPLRESLALLSRLAPLTRRKEGAVVSLPMHAVQEVHGARTVPLAGLRGERVLVFAGIGDPWALAAQLRDAGLAVELQRFGDHHRYTAGEIERLAERAGAVDRVVCTLKDAVKLRGRWPRQAPALWYFSQRVEVEEGRGVVEAMLGRLLDARRLTTPITAG